MLKRFIKGVGPIVSGILLFMCGALTILFGVVTIPLLFVLFTINLAFVVFLENHKLSSYDFLEWYVYNVMCFTLTWLIDGGYEKIEKSLLEKLN